MNTTISARKVCYGSVYVLAEAVNLRTAKRRIHELARHLRNANHYAFQPYFSVFRVSATGEYYQLYFGQSSRDAARAAIREAKQPWAVGVECRVNGIRVNW